MPHIDNDRDQILIFLFTVVLFQKKRLNTRIAHTTLQTDRHVQSENQIVIIKRLYHARAFNLNNGTLARVFFGAGRARS